MITLLTHIKSYWIAFTLLTLAAITTLSLWPLEVLPSVPGSDKIHHVIAYAALMFPAALRKPNHWKLIGLLFIVFSGVIELLQPFANRYGEWLDMVANTTGVVFGLLVAELLSYFFPVRLNSPDDL
jgi:VanZ family protein